MSTVTLSIGPKSYSIACADGQEAHIEALGAMIAEKYAQLGASRAPLEAQNLLFAALFMADELAEARKQLAAPPPAPEPDTSESDALRATIDRLEAELAHARKAAEAASAALPDPSESAAADAEMIAAIAEKLEALATQAEATAAALEADADSA